MSVVVRALNNDASYLLTFTHPTSSSSFNVVVDPWLSGGVINTWRWLDWSALKENPNLSTLNEIPGGVDLVVISQEGSDHCHRDTLLKLPAMTKVLAEEGAAKKIRGWNHFQHVEVIPVFNHEVDVLVVPHQAMDSDFQLGEFSFTILRPASRLAMAIHRSLGITYQPFTFSGYHSDFTSDPESPTSFVDKQALVRPLTIIHSPHGMPCNVLEPYVDHFLEPRGGLPITALLHPYDSISVAANEICTGAVKGAGLAKRLTPLYWIRTHDAEKYCAGLTLKRPFFKQSKYTDQQVKEMLANKAQENPALELVVPLELKIDGTVEAGLALHQQRELALYKRLELVTSSTAPTLKASEEEAKEPKEQEAEDIPKCLGACFGWYH